MIKKKKNVILVLNGHFVNTSNENRGYSRRITDVADSGNIVHQIFVNYQRDGNGTLSNPTGSNNVGMGYFLRLRFSPKSGKVYTSYYSSYLNQYDTRIDSFNVYLPGVKIQNSPGVLGGLYVKKEARFDDTVTIKSVSKYSVVTIGDDNKLVGDTNFVYKNRKVGIGVSTPLTQLHVVGIATADSLIGGSTASDSIFIGSTSNATKGNIWLGNSIKSREVNGYTGIGTVFSGNRASNPGNAIHVAMDNTSNFESGITIENKCNIAGAFSRLRLINDAGGTAQVFYDRSGGTFLPNGALFGCSTAGGTAFYNSGSGNIYFAKSTTISGANILATLLTSNGNFLLGTSTDNGYKLQVFGSGYFKDSLKIDNIPNGNSNDSLAVIRNNVLYKETLAQARGYSVYNALLSQSGTSDPTAVVLGNNQVGSIVWTRSALGAYVGTLSGAFPANKTFILVGQNADGILANCFRIDNNTITLKTYLNPGGSTDVFSDVSIEIRVYP